MFQEMGGRLRRPGLPLSANCPEFHYCWFGLSLIGAISVPVNTAYKRDETAFILNDAGAKAVVTHPTLLAVADAAVNLSPGVQHKLLVATPVGSDAPAPSAPEEPAVGTAFDPAVEPEWANFDDALAQAQMLAERRKYCRRTSQCWSIPPAPPATPRGCR